MRRRKHASGDFQVRAQERVRLARFEVTEGTRENRCARTTNASDSCFTGKEEDIDVGLTYFGKRYLSPYLNRWISPDPLAVHGLGADLNLYAYVSGRALKAVDPLGLQEALATLIPDGWSFTVTGCGQEGVASLLGTTSPVRRVVPGLRRLAEKRRVLRLRMVQQPASSGR
ncbi:MAG: RHS repeat-associated core domain-containing protein [Polyangiaceae bacterium]|nr:RHS repeat-associated core domain-containing protein [Polyangiaceae bacterium]